jgi:hypothetical protein
MSLDKFNNLLFHLQNKQWKEADEETNRLVVQIGDKKKQGYLKVDDIVDFPCEDLRTIDQLWVYHSNGHFGFSVQKDIYFGLGGTKKIWKKYAEKVGWRKGDLEWLYYSDLTFELLETTPKGHLPAQVANMLSNTYRERQYQTWEWYPISHLFSRLQTCRV